MRQNNNLYGFNPEDVVDDDTLFAAEDENKLINEELVLSEIEPCFFTEEKIIERIVNGTLNTVPLGDLIR